METVVGWWIVDVNFPVVHGCFEIVCILYFDFDRIVGNIWENQVENDMKGLNKVLASILIGIFGYTGFEKLIRFKDSRRAFHNQTFPAELAELLSYSIPVVELLIALLLLFSATRWWGYLGSILLLTVFITYVGLIWVGAFPRVPCNCAGILESLGWAEHFYLNLGLIGISSYGLWMERKGMTGLIGKS